MAFVMRGDWQEEPLSITAAEYVEPSAEMTLRRGQRVSHLFPRSVMEEYVLQRLTERTYWFSRHFYCTLFYVGNRGVLLLDPPQGAADSLLKAIGSVTSLPVAAICYSHFHADHIGGARKLVTSLAASPRVIASEHTAVWMERFGSDLPRPGHAPDHAVFLLAEERIGHSADLINIDQLPFGGFAGQDPLVLFKPNLQFARDLEFDWFSGGHGNIGEKSDFDFYLGYLDEVTELINEEIPRPETVPDLYLTDYLSGLGAEERGQLLAELNNHFSLYLYGRQIAAGEKPDRSAAGPGAFSAGLVGEWAAGRQRAVDEAVPRIMDRLRPKYGRMYNFEDAQPINIRVLASSMQPSLTNR